MESRWWLLRFCCTVLCVVILTEMSYGCRPPEIYRQGRQLQYYSTGKSPVWISCHASGDPPLVYTWLKNGRPLNLSDNSTVGYSMPKLLQFGIGDLAIDTRFIAEEMAHYQCLASNPCGTSVSLRTVLMRAVLDPFPVLDRPRHVRLYVGTFLRLRCDVPRSIPKSHVTWMVMSGQDPESWEEVEYKEVPLNDRVVMSYEGSLYITNVRKEDMKISTKQPHTLLQYVCQVTNPIARTIVLGGDTIIEVWERGSIAPQFPTGLRWSSHTDMIGVVGRPVKMMCIFSGNPQPNITWTREGSEFNDSRMIRSTHELVILDVQPEDVGVYTCSAFNGIGSVVRKSFTLGSVQSPPSWENPPSDFTIQLGDNTSPSFDCRATGNPTPVVSFFINGRPYEELPPDPNISLQDDILTLGSMTVNDSLAVQCNASNRHGYIWADNFIHHQVPGEVTSMIQTDRCAHRLSLRWTEPEDAAGSVLGYNLTYRKVNNAENTEEEVVETQDSTAILTGLEEDTVYYVLIKTKTSVGTTDAKNFLFKTPEEQWSHPDCSAA